MKKVIALCLLLLAPSAVLAEFQACQTGLWYNADRDGEGWNLFFGNDNVFDGNDVFLATAYTFNPNTKRQVWYITSVDNDYDSKEQLTVILYKGTLDNWGDFNQDNFEAGELEEVGEATFSFVDDSNITLSFFASVEAGGFSPSLTAIEAIDFPLTLVTPRVTTCD